MKKQNHCERANEEPSTSSSLDGNFSRPKFYSKRGARLLIGGLVGGTAIGVVMAFMFDDWSHLKRWLSGLAVVGLLSVYFFIKKWLRRRTIQLAEPMVEPVSRTGEPDAEDL